MLILLIITHLQLSLNHHNDTEINYMFTDLKREYDKCLKKEKKIVSNYVTTTMKLCTFISLCELKDLLVKTVKNCANLLSIWRINRP